MASLLPSDYHALTLVERSRDGATRASEPSAIACASLSPGGSWVDLLCCMDITPTHRAFAGPLKASYTEPIEQRIYFPDRR